MQIIKIFSSPEKKIVHTTFKTLKTIVRIWNWQPWTCSMLSFKIQEPISASIWLEKQSWKPEQCTMVWDTNSETSITFPRCRKWVSHHVCETSSAEQANEWGVRANKQIDKKVAQYLDLDSYCFKPQCKGPTRKGGGAFPLWKRRQEECQHWATAHWHRNNSSYYGGGDGGRVGGVEIGSLQRGGQRLSQRSRQRRW